MELRRQLAQQVEEAKLGEAFLSLHKRYETLYQIFLVVDSAHRLVPVDSEDPGGEIEQARMIVREFRQRARDLGADDAYRFVAIADNMQAALGGKKDGELIDCEPFWREINNLSDHLGPPLKRSWWSNRGEVKRDYDGWLPRFVADMRRVRLGER